MGVISSLNDLNLTISSEIVISNNNYLFKLSKNKNKNTNILIINLMDVNVFKLSESGKEILELIDDKCSNDDFFIDNIKSIKGNFKNSCEYEVKRIKYIDFKNDIIYTIDENENLINDI